jgi:hypothetical protein
MARPESVAPQNFTRKSKDLQCRPRVVLAEMLDDMLDVFGWSNSPQEQASLLCSSRVLNVRFSSIRGENADIAGGQKRATKRHVVLAR